MRAVLALAALSPVQGISIVGSMYVQPQQAAPVQLALAAPGAGPDLR